MDKDYELSKAYHDKLVVDMCKTEEGKQILVDVGIIKEDGTYTDDLVLILEAAEERNDKE